MPGFNLLRNARAFFTTNLTSTTNPNEVATTGAAASTAWELQVLGGFSFSQATNAQQITVSEAGLTPARGQRSFNTSLAPVDFSFSTYIRPSGTTTIDCEEKQLWNALLSSNSIDTAGLSLAAVTGFTRTANLDTITFTFTAVNLNTAGIAVGDTVTIGGITGTDALEWNSAVKITAIAGTATACTGLTIAYLKAPAGTGTAPATVPTTFKIYKGAFTQNPTASPEAAYALIHSGGSAKNQLLPFGMVIVMDTVTYLIDNCVLDQASIDFGLDGIATVAWTGKGTAIRQVAATTLGAGTASGGWAGAFTAKNTTAKYITNKLSTVSLLSTIRGIGTSPTTYTVALTGGNITIANNVNYITPENLNTVNKPVGYFTGTRSITGSLNAYLKTGTNNTSQLLTDLLAAASTTVETKYSAEIQIGGNSNSTKVEVELPALSLQIPTIDAGGDILSTVINFTSQGFDGSSSLAATVSSSGYDVEANNDLFIRYYNA